MAKNGNCASCKLTFYKIKDTGLCLENCPLGYEKSVSSYECTGNNERVQFTFDRLEN